MGIVADELFNGYGYFLPAVHMNMVCKSVNKQTALPPSKDKISIYAKDNVEY